MFCIYQAAPGEEVEVVQMAAVARARASGGSLGRTRAPGSSARKVATGSMVASMVASMAARQVGKGRKAKVAKERCI